ncbi:protein CHROMATIN REMODELING 20 isoform X2 [Cucumis melo var. makuwa]|uniref:Protein CHROMATIN REMODELING 20 isoform X2 n=1 Tax=Cucumis melo var. makuwa TaxID=1194695 RepID=A0A5D3BI13_CUCMM|nr:protein CHROMATIN REMODELING 20 isoform X2 [Cucumis melo var. makuwa]
MGVPSFFEAQEALEKESLAKVEKEVREELALTLNGDDLETAIANEMATFVEEWEIVLDELEIESAHLLWSSSDASALVMLDTKSSPMAKVDNRIHFNSPTIQITTTDLMETTFFIGHKVLDCVFLDKGKSATLLKRKLPKNPSLFVVVGAMNVHDIVGTGEGRATTMANGLRLGGLGRHGRSTDK